jgi:hypothetical protein
MARPALHRPSAGGSLIVATRAAAGKAGQRRGRTMAVFTVYS